MSKQDNWQVRATSVLVDECETILSRAVFPLEFRFIHWLKEKCRTLSRSRWENQRRWRIQHYWKDWKASRTCLVQYELCWDQDEADWFVRWHRRQLSNLWYLSVWNWQLWATMFLLQAICQAKNLQWQYRLECDGGVKAKFDDFEVRQRIVLIKVGNQPISWKCFPTSHDNNYWSGD